MRRLNLIFGLLLFLAFILSGQYMRHVFTPEHLDDLVQRAQIRSNHIYVLLSALLNLLASRIPSGYSKHWQGYADTAARTLMMIAACFLVTGFWYEHDGDLANRKFTRLGLFGTLGAVGLMIVNGWLSPRAD
ncbi:MAG: hypothetical protein AAFO03_24540 [Bacteroidota bacterium]